MVVIIRHKYANPQSNAAYLRQIGGNKITDDNLQKTILNIKNSIINEFKSFNIEISPNDSLFNINMIENETSTGQPTKIEIQ